jgi:hypothetical protein
MTFLEQILAKFQQQGTAPSEAQDFARTVASRIGRTESDDDEYDDEGYGTDGFDRDGYNRDGWDREGWSKDGFLKFAGLKPLAKPATPLTPKFKPGRLIKAIGF